MRRKTFSRIAAALAIRVVAGLLLGVQAPCAVRNEEPERMIITGVPPFGPTQWRDGNGNDVPAGCCLPSVLDWLT